MKEHEGHGKFLAWIEENFGWSERTARNFMMVHDRFKTANFADLEIDVSSLYLLAAPSTPEPVREVVMKYADEGERIVQKDVKVIRDHHKKTGALPKDTATIREMAAECEKAGKPDILPSLETNGPVYALVRRDGRRYTPTARNFATAKRRMINILSQIRGLCRGVEVMNADVIARAMTKREGKDWIGMARVTSRVLREFAQRMEKTNAYTDDGDKQKQNGNTAG